MIQSIDSEVKKIVQKCDSCGAENNVYYSGLSIQNGKVMELPACSCGAVEFLLLTGKTRDHDMKVAVVFAEVRALNS